MTMFQGSPKARRSIHDIAGEKPADSGFCPAAIQFNKFWRDMVVIGTQRFAHGGLGQAVAQFDAIGQNKGDDSTDWVRSWTLGSS